MWHRGLLSSRRHATGVLAGAARAHDAHARAPRPRRRGLPPRRRIAFGHRRLSIVDLETGRQPMANEDGERLGRRSTARSTTIRELRQLLESKGHRFRTRTDTETIVHAYEEWGTACLERLRGMFAFALWDARAAAASSWRATGSARSRSTTRAASRRRWLFGSEIKALAAVPGLDRSARSGSAQRLPLAALRPARRRASFAVSASCLPGHLLIADARGIRLRSSYWDLRLRASGRRRRCGAARGGAAARGGRGAAAQRRAARRVPERRHRLLGRGGPDGADVDAAGGDHLDRLCRGRFDERPQRGRWPRTSGRTIATGGHAGARRSLERVAWHYDEPFGDASALPTYYLSELARRE